jgi:hypothetical protein
MRDTTAFTDQDNWAGGHYELAIELGDTSDERLQRALTAVWRAARIEGCYRSLDHEPAAQPEIPCTVASLAEFGHLRGTVELHTGHRVVCGAFGGRYDEGQDWLDFYLPTGALARTDRRVGGFPFGPDSGTPSLLWRRGLDDWLAEIGTAVYQEVDFRLAVIGFEIDAAIDARSLEGKVPDERWEAYLLPTDGQLQYTPANR